MIDDRSLIVLHNQAGTSSEMAWVLTYPLASAAENNAENVAARGLLRQLLESLNVPFSRGVDRALLRS
jgi:hypothetical protein